MITAVVTKKGRILQNKQLNGADLVFTRAVAGTASTAIDKLQDQTAISNIAQTLSIQSVKLDDSKQSYTILVLLENTNLKTAYNLNQIGFYANDPNNGEILFAIAQFDTPKKIELPTVNPGYTLEMPFTFQNSNSANVIIDFNPDNLMSRAGVEAMLDSEEISGISNGNVIAVTNSAESPFLDFKLFGKSKQVTTKGYQIFDPSEMITKTQGGATVTKNDDSSFTISGNGTITETFNHTVNLTHEETIKLLKSGSLKLKCEKKTMPFFIARLNVNDLNVASISNQYNAESEAEIRQEWLDDASAYLRLTFYGALGDNVVSGTIKPMLYQDGDGTWEPFSPVLSISCG